MIADRFCGPLRGTNITVFREITREVSKAHGSGQKKYIYLEPLLLAILDRNLFGERGRFNDVTGHDADHQIAFMTLRQF